MHDTRIMFEYSAIKKNANRMPLYSVKKPATNSLSASGRSKGSRLVSATEAIKKTTKAMNCGKGKGSKANQFQKPPAWASVISTRLKLPDNNNTPTIASPTLSS